MKMCAAALRRGEMKFKGISRLNSLFLWHAHIFMSCILMSVSVSRLTVNTNHIRVVLGSADL